MATAEEIRLAHEAVIELERIRENIRNNADDYKRAVNQAQPIPAAQVIAVMKADANEFQRRLERLRRAVDTPAIKTKLLNGLAVLGVDWNAVRSDYVAMNDLMQQLWDANLSTANHVRTAADTILASLPSHDSVIGGPLPFVR